MGLEAELKGLLSDSLLGPEEEGVESAMGSRVMDVERKNRKFPRADVVVKMDVDDYGAVCNDRGKNRVRTMASLHSDVKSSMLSGSIQNPCQKKARTEKTGVGLIEFTKCQINSSDVSIPCSNDGISDQKSMTSSLEEITSSKCESKWEEVESNERKKSGDDDDDDLLVLDPVTARKTFSQKRKRESLGRMLCWITGIAKNPCHPEVDSLPEISKWKSFGTEYWQQILLAREATFSKRHKDLGADQLSLQRNLRMHPAMYDDHGSGYKNKLRCRESLLSKRKASGEEGASSKSSSCKKRYLDQQSGGSSNLSAAELIFEDHSRQQVPLGPGFQAVEPPWTGLDSESESKWLGTKIWPPENTESKHVTERVLTGKERKSSCGCQLPGSTECVRFHIAEKRLDLKRELGSAFYKWDFDKMGEEVALSWTKDEEKKFKNLVVSNPPSLQKSFWGEICKSFPDKSRKELVSYYFNVSLLKRRGYQNRVTPSSINSDDDDETVWDTD